jgi:DNA-directed RNA polymerase
MDRKKEISKLINLKFKKEFEKVNKIKEKINLDDLNYVRVNIKTGEAREEKRYIKIRIKKKGNMLDINALQNSLSPSTTHSEDASILIKLILRCKKYKIKLVPIHDSTGARIYFASILKVAYKESFIEYLEHCLSENEFPINEIISRKEHLDFKEF